jgi:hypothetical protein
MIKLGRKDGLEMRTFLMFFVVVGMLLAFVNVPCWAQDFKVYAGAKLDEKASREASAAAPGKQSEVYTTDDAYDKVYAFYKGLYKEYTMPGRGAGASGKVKMAFFIIDSGKDLSDSKYWMKVQRPYIGRPDGTDTRDTTVIQTVRTK